MSVRSPGSLVVALLSLAASAILGGLLIHDGEVGTDDGMLYHARPGDTLRLKGELVPAYDGRATELAHVARLLIEGVDFPVLVLADFALPHDGSWVVTAKVHSAYDEEFGTPPVLQALEVKAPLVFA